MLSGSWEGEEIELLLDVERERETRLEHGRDVEVLHHDLEGLEVSLAEFLDSHYELGERAIVQRNEDSDAGYLALLLLHF